MKNKNKNKKAFTLIEILIGVGIAGLSLVGIYALYSMIQSTSNAKDETSRLISYIDTAKSVASSNGNFNSINIEYLEDIGADISYVLGLSSIVGDGETLTINYSGVDSSICSKFASNVYSSGLDIDIIISGKEVDKELEPIAEITTSCASNGLSDLSFRITENITDQTLTDESLVPNFNYNSGNVNSLDTKALTLSQYQIVSGQSASNTLYGDQGVGFAVSGQPAPVYPPVPENNPPITVPPTDIPSNPENPMEDPNYTQGFNLPNGELDFVDTEINFTLNNWNTINVATNGINVEVFGLLPLYHYKAEFSSRLFGLDSNNPVKVGEEMVGAEELTLSAQADGDTRLFLNNNESVDVSAYFRKFISENEDGSLFTDPNEPMNPSLKSFFETSFMNYPVVVDIIDEISGASVGKYDLQPELLLPAGEPMKVGDELLVGDGCLYNANTFAVKWISDDFSKKYVIYIHNGQIMKIDDILGLTVVENYPGWYSQDEHGYYYPYTRLPSSMEITADRYPVLKTAIQTLNMNYKYSGEGGPGHTFVDACYKKPTIQDETVVSTNINYTEIRPTTAQEKIINGDIPFAALTWNDARVTLPFNIEDIRRVSHNLSGVSNVIVDQKDLKTFDFKLNPTYMMTIEDRDFNFSANVTLKNGRRYVVKSHIVINYNKSYIDRQELEIHPDYPTCFEVLCYSNPIRPVDGVPGVALPEDVPEIIKRARELGLENLEIRYSTSNSGLSPFQHVPSRRNMNNIVGIDSLNWKMDKSLFGWEGYPAGADYNMSSGSARYDLYQRGTNTYVGRFNVNWTSGGFHEGLELNKYYSFYLSEMVPNGKSYGNQLGVDITYVICLKGKGVYNGTKVVCQP